MVDIGPSVDSEKTCVLTDKETDKLVDGRTERRTKQSKSISDLQFHYIRT